MPWTVGDVDRFKQGLSDAQKRRWVRIANSALRKCQSEGGQNCEARAIRQANGTVGNNSEGMEAIEDLILQKMQVNNYQIRRETFEGVKHIVVPVIMMKEGVHGGSHGPMFHRSEELSKYVDAWNGIPVTILHPEEDGMNVSANSPSVIESTVVGRVFNAHYNEGLRAEAWLDEVKLRSISPETLAQIEEGYPLDVSVGVFSDTDETPGEWNGETYDSVAQNYRPDHLALLPGEVGACSWEDGCGVRANRKGGSMDDKKLEVIKRLNHDGFAVVPINNEQGYRELVNSLQSKLDAMDTHDRVYYLQEVYEDYFVYAVRGREGGETLYKRGYAVSDSGEVAFAEDAAVEVRRKVEYVAMKEFVRARSFKSNNKNGGKMACCEDKVDRLIAHKQTRFSADDKEFLMGLEESQLDKLFPMEAKKPEKTEDPAPQVNKEEVIDEFKDTLKTIEDYTALMPEGMKAQVDNGVKLYKEHREALVKGIVENTGENFSKEKLEAMDDETLESIYKSVQPKDYSGQGATPGTFSGGSDEEEFLLPIGFSVNQKKED
mgnify:CR=1 FL=1